MPFELVALDLLKASLKESIITLIKSHIKPLPYDESKAEELIQKLPEERRVQVKFLQKTMLVLDKSPPKTELEGINQARILNAAAYYVRDQIAKTYNYVSPERSTFFNSLTTSLNLKVDNQPVRNDLVDMYAALEEFMRNQVFKDGDPRKGIVKKHPYLIRGYCVENDIISLATKVFDWRIEIITEAKETRLKETTLKETTTAWSWFSSTSQPEKTNEISYVVSGFKGH